MTLLEQLLDNSPNIDKIERLNQQINELNLKNRELTQENRNLKQKINTVKSKLSGMNLQNIKNLLED